MTKTSNLNYMKMIEKDIFDELMSTEIKINAWAIWDKETMKFPYTGWEKLRKRLTTDVIFLGLNPSKKLNKVRNFHSKSVGDTRLMEAILGIPGENSNGKELKNISGGFMTDLLDVIESDSLKVDTNSASFDHFENVLNKLDEPQYHIICFGNKVFDAVRGWLTNQQILSDDIVKCNSISVGYNVTLYKVMHYSYRFDKNIIGDQLQYLDELIGKKRSQR